MKKRLSMQWHITDTCDQRCKHCYIYEGKDEHCQKELDLNTLEEILTNYLESCSILGVLPNLVITGGDPILHKNFWEFLEIVKKNNVPFQLLGNPFHLNYEVVKKLEELGCKSYQMSLDGTEKIHDEIRKPGSFKATIDALKYFKNTKIHTVIMNTVSKTNIDTIPDLVDIVVENEVNTFAFARYCPNPDDAELMVSPEEYKEFLGKMWDKFEEHEDSKTEFAFKDHLWKLFLYEKGLFNPEEVNNPNNLILDGCHCGICHITTLADGTVYACRRCDSPIGHVPEESFYEIFTGEKLDEYRQYDKFEGCQECPLKNFCRGCPAVAKCLTGNFYAKDPQCWWKK